MRRVFDDDATLNSLTQHSTSFIGMRLPAEFAKNFDDFGVPARGLIR
jgi:hypothetical protein